MPARQSHATTARRPPPATGSPLDADDVRLPDKLERQLPATEDPKAAVVAGGVVGRRAPHFHPAPDFDALWTHNIIATSSVLMRREVLAAGGMAAHLPLCEDYNLWLRLAGTDLRIVVVDAPVVIYSPTDESLTRDLIRFAETERACIEETGATFGLPRERIRQRVASSYHAYGRGAVCAEHEGGAPAADGGVAARPELPPHNLPGGRQYADRHAGSAPPLLQGARQGA